MKASSSVFINRPIIYVWEFIEDVRNLGRWVNGVSEPAPTSDEGSWGIGSTFKSDYDYAGKRHTVSYVITEFDPPNRVSIRSTSGSFSFEGYTELQEEKEGTRLINTIDMKPANRFLSAFFVLIGMPLRVMMSAQLRKELSQLKAILESVELKEPS